jgi:hypothetical protein
MLAAKQMAPLTNPRHESFVRYLLQGKDATDAYEAAGFKRDDGNAARLKSNPKVTARLAELQSEIAAKVPITIESLIAELEEVRHAATGKNQFAAAVRAVLGKAQLSGLLVERQKVEVGPPGSFDGLETTEAIADKLAEQWLSDINWWHPRTEEDQAKLAAIFAEAFERAGDFIDTIKARPPSKLAIAPPYANTNGKIRP